ncbi:MAG: signal peptide peptidase SppA [Spirochaetes bacterium]|nr:MAG: signal peptide peptidase SppA [Spirochaetota bacterium]
MDKNRKILISILMLLVLSSVLAIIDISLTMQGTRRALPTLATPDTGPGVGVVRVYGTISSIARSGGPFDGDAGADGVIRRLSELEADGRIKAVVLRINSPGGTVGASQEIYEKLMKLRKKNVVLVASMAELAASGGYYIASACGHICANQGTITGSIGVIASAPNLKGLFERLGIHMNVIKSGKYKDMLAAHKDMTPEERDIVQKLIDSAYHKFVKDVSVGRNLAISDIEPYADGRVMNGEAAVACKLVDEVGTFEDAIARAKILAKLPEDAPVYEESHGPFDRFLGMLSGVLGPETRVDRLLMMGPPMIEYRYQP